MGKTGGGRGTNQYRVRGRGQSRPDIQKITIPSWPDPAEYLLDDDEGRERLANSLFARDLWLWIIRQLGTSDLSPEFIECIYNKGENSDNLYMHRMEWQMTQRSIAGHPNTPLALLMQMLDKTEDAVLRSTIMTRTDVPAHLKTIGLL